MYLIRKVYNSYNVQYIIKMKVVSGTLCKKKYF